MRLGEFDFGEGAEGVRFDDRIKTVLEHPVVGDRDRAVRWRQLIDLLSRVRADSDPYLVARALDMARQDRATVPDEVRAATARSIARRAAGGTPSRRLNGSLWGADTIHKHAS